MAGPEKKYVQSVERALDILSFVADRGSVRLGDVCEHTGLRTSTAFGLLQTLEHCGYLARAAGSKEYALGIASLRLGLCYDYESGIAASIHHLLEIMADRVGETAYFEVQTGSRYYYVDMVLSKLPLKVVPDSDSYIDLPDNSAVAKAFRGVGQGLRYGTDLEEVEAGLNCFAAPFFLDGELLGCVALTGPSNRLTAERMEEVWETYQQALVECGLV